jgi:excisionase family DNA binding protein
MSREWEAVQVRRPRFAYIGAILVINTGEYETLITVEEACKLSSLSRSTVNALIARSLFPAPKIGKARRIVKGPFVEFLHSGYVGPIK